MFGGKRVKNKVIFVLLFFCLLFDLKSTDTSDERQGFLGLTPEEMDTIWMSIATNLPQPARHFNGYYFASSYQEKDWRNYIKRNPYIVAKTLPLIFGNFETTVYSSEYIGTNLIYQYSTYCISWVFTFSCISGNSERFFEKALISEITYNLLEITPLFVRLKIKYFGTPK